jgi:hypothetical protein
MKRAAFFMVFAAFLALQAMLEQAAHAAEDSNLQPLDSDIDVIVRATVSGIVNDSALEGTVLSSFNTGLGGSSTCTFSRLPAGFTAATRGTG